VVVVQEVERKRQHPPGALVVKVHRGGTAEGREERIAGNAPGERSMNFLVSSNGSGPVSPSTPARNCLNYGMYRRIMFTCSATCLTLSIPVPPGLRLVPNRTRFDARQDGWKPFWRSRLRCGSESSDSCSRRYGASIRAVPPPPPPHVVVEPHPKLGRAADDRILHLGQQERQVVPKLLEPERL